METSPPVDDAPIPSTLTREELIDLAGVDGATVDRLEAAGTLAPRDGERPFRAGDVYRVRLVLACEAAGMAADAIGAAIDSGAISLAFLDMPHYRWAGLSTITYGELADRMDLPVDVVLDVARSMGSIGRSKDDRVRQDELDVFPVIRFASAMMDHDALVRTARVYAQSLQRITDAEGALWQTYILGGFLRQGMSFRDAVDAANAFGSEVTAMQERLLINGYRRQQERQWTEFTVEGIEAVLDDMGLYERPERPNAFAFLDLAGYTALTEERGDQASARIAAELGAMVDSIAAEWGGRPIKWLGDGVMVHFRDPADAVGGTLRMVARAPEAGLPAHAGIAAGPFVFQDGDYFGRTVNLAARVAAAAGAGTTYADAEVVRAASGAAATFEEVGALELKGFAAPVTIYEVRSSAGTGSGLGGAGGTGRRR